jgi:hypothetical protein
MLCFNISVTGDHAVQWMNKEAEMLVKSSLVNGKSKFMNT